MGPFTLQTRVADALAAHPALRDLLPAFHPAFEKLRHPILGRVLPRLVTIEGAARVAGVEPEALLDVFNLSGPPAAGALPAVPRRQDPDPAWLNGAPIEEVDVRPLVEAGKEPFAPIMGALRQLPTGAVLQVRVPFEPAPLVDLLGRRGWEAQVLWEGEDCLARFFRPPMARDATPEDVSFEDRLRGEVLDVRGLEPPLPLQMALSAIERQLPLTLIHHREPALLYGHLQERGLAWETTHHDDHVEVRIHAP